MDLNKLRADLEASQALTVEAQGKIAALNSDITAKDAEIAQLRADLDAATTKATSAEQALATAKDEHKLATAKLEGKLEASAEQITKLEAEAKTLGHRAADIVRGRAFEGDHGNTPDGSQRSSAQQGERPESAQDRTKAAFEAMMAPHLSK